MRGSYTGWLLVPVADVEILVLSSNRTKVELQAATTIGVTSVPWAIVATLFAVAVGLAVLWWVAPLGKGNRFLRVLTTPGGYASLSQLQILLWTFVVAASAIYVMTLSGELIAITEGTLWLLGIAGIGLVGSALHGQKDGSGPAAGKPETNTPAPATPPTTPIRADRAPLLSDLVVRPTKVTLSDGSSTIHREVDPTRVQMLFFTLIAAGFVVMSVVTNYVIPEIPDGIVTLMGLSNGVYLAAKWAQQ